MNLYLLVKLKTVMKAKRAQIKSVRYQRLMHAASGLSSITEVGFLPVYVGDEMQRFLVKMEHLSHPLFRMLLEKAFMEYGFEQRSGLVIPCEVGIFEEVVAAVESSNGQFNHEMLIKELL